ncbi:MAG: glycosyltransferase family 2 protein [Hyphomicrobiales bacterium]|nr:glycosyltransferase family 2 protein [Hyphomicrobiales bacterium]
MGVVIPFYQEATGPLSRAVKSVFEQDIDASETQVHIVVVDDGSTVSAKSELAGLAAPDGFKLSIVEQTNAGAAAARNRGLDELGSSADLVAFLDSDDVWKTNHLKAAIDALGTEKQAGFYCCDHTRPGHHASYFELIGVDEFLRHIPGVADKNLVRLSREDAFGLFLRHVIAQTSTVVYRPSSTRAVRFRESMKSAGEDHLFWMEAIQASESVFISRDLNVVCETGVNIYFSQLSWDSPGALRRVADRIRCFSTFEKELSVSGDQADFIRDKLRRLRDQFSFLCLRAILKRKGKGAAALSQLRHDDPTFDHWFPRSVLRVTIARLTGKFVSLQE